MFFNDRIAQKGVELCMAIENGFSHHEICDWIFQFPCHWIGVLKIFGHQLSVTIIDNQSFLVTNFYHHSRRSKFSNMPKNIGSSPKILSYLINNDHIDPTTEKKKLLMPKNFGCQPGWLKIFWLLNWGIGKFQSLIVVTESWWPNFSGNAWKHFCCFLKNFNHPMDQGLISTI